MVAKDLTFSIGQDFLEALQSDHYVDFQKLNESQYKLIGIGQEFDFVFSDVKHRPKVPFELTINYRSETELFSETFCFDFNKQIPIYTVGTIEEKLLQISKEQQGSLDDIASGLRIIAGHYDEK